MGASAVPVPRLRVPYAGVFALTPAAASTYRNASAVLAWPVRVKAERCWAPAAFLALRARTDYVNDVVPAR
jgi:hypothetical protein